MKIIKNFDKIDTMKRDFTMDLKERHRYFGKKIIFIFLFLAFWILSAIHVFRLESGRELAIGVFYLLIFLPITIAILLDYEVFALFIIIIYEIAMLIMSIVLLSSGLARSELTTFDIFSLLVDGLFAIFLIASAIQYLRNKNHSLKIACLVVAVAHLVMVIISFILNGEFIFDTFYDFFRNVILILIFSKIRVRVFRHEFRALRR